VRIGGRALRNPTMQLIAAAAFVAIFAFDVPFPLIVLAAGIVGYLGGRAGRPEFETGGGHGASKGVVVADADSALGEAMPDHARPSALWSLRVAAIFLALWLVPVGLIRSCSGRPRLWRHPLFYSLQRWRSVTFSAPTHVRPMSP
jgi:chromate transporter